VGGVRTCFKRENLCNLHPQVCTPSPEILTFLLPQCDPVDESNTAEDELNCDVEYMKKRLIPRQATYRCQSLYHNEDSMRRGTSRGVVWIRAALNDGNPECWKDEDEIERSTDWVSYYFPGWSSIFEKSTDWVSYYFPGWSSIFEKSAPFELKRNALLTTLPSLPREWMVEFELKLTNLDHSGYTNIFHMTTAPWGTGSLQCSITPEGLFSIISHDNQNGNYHQNFPPPPIGKWTKIRVSQELIDGKYRYRIFIDEREETNVENSAAVGFENVKVFAADPWWEAQPGSIKNLKINVKGN
jgi:hypothetical protein